MIPLWKFVAAARCYIWQIERAEQIEWWHGLSRTVEPSLRPRGQTMSDGAFWLPDDRRQRAVVVEKQAG